MANGALTVTKQFTFKGDPTERWGNTYYYLGADPADAAAWRAFFDAVVLEEKKLYGNEVTVVGGYGYDSDDPTAHAIWALDLTVPPNSPVAGTYSDAGNQRGIPDSAGWIRWGTSRLNTKGKRIYLRKYFHPARLAAAGADPAISSTWITAAGVYAGYWSDGTHFGNRTLSAPGHDDSIIGHAVSAWPTTRTLKRRGKRPGS